MPPAPRTEFDWFRERNSPPRRKDRQEVDQPNHKPLTIRLMPSLIRGTFQSSRSLPSARCTLSMASTTGSAICSICYFVLFSVSLRRKARERRKRLELRNLSSQPCGLNESRPAELGQQPEASLAWGGVTLTAKRRQRVPMPCY